MMPNIARYYLGRIHKFGDLDQERLVDAILNPASVERRNYRFTFTDAERAKGKYGEYVFARLAKYKPRTEVDIVRPDEHKEDIANVKNMIDASSPFVYLPEYSGIAYQHIPGRLEKIVFERAFSDLITNKYEAFFMRCEIEAITDLRTFVARLSRLRTIKQIDAVVKPPNPLFGKCWASLKEYLKQRNLEEVAIKEDAKAGGTINTDLQRISELMIKSEGNREEFEKMLKADQSIGIGDAAILMAADGYGKGKVQGIEDGKTIVINTRDRQKNFIFGKEPTPNELYLQARTEFQAINDERYLDH